MINFKFKNPVILFISGMILFTYSTSYPQTKKRLTINKQDPISEERLASLSARSDLSEKNIIDICDILKSQDQVSVAITFIENHRNNSLISVNLHKLLAEYYIELDNMPIAILNYKNIIKTEPQNAGNYKKIAALYVWNDQQPEGIQAYEIAAQINPQDVFVLKELNKLYSWNNRENDAFLIQKKILEQEPQNIELWKQHGIQARWLQKNDEAIRSFKNILRVNRTDAEAFLLLGETFMWTSKTKEAIICFREVIRLDPDNIQAYYYYAELQHWQPFGWWQAQNNYRRILVKNPDHQDSKKQLNLIRKEYGPLVQNKTNYISDSNKLKKLEVTSVYEKYFTPRWQLRGELLYRHLEEQKMNNRVFSYGKGARIRNRWHFSPKTRIIGSMGFIDYNQREIFFLSELEVQQTISDKSIWPGELYSSFILNYDNVLDGVLAIKNRYTSVGVKQINYWVPIKALQIGSDIQYSWYSDDNKKFQIYLSGEYCYYSKLPKLFVKLIYAYQDMLKIYPTAIPYWTPNDFWLWSIGKDILIPVKNSLSIRGGYAMTIQFGNEIANNWKLQIDWLPTGFTNLFFHYQDFGSKYYAYKSFQTGFSFRF